MPGFPYADIPEGQVIVQRGDEFFLVPQRWKAEVETLLQGKKAQAQKIGEAKGKISIPSHGFATCSGVQGSMPNTGLSREDALKYLRKGVLPPSLFQHTGWQTVCFENATLGLVKVLEGRVNNYYPVEFRLRLMI